MVKVDVELEEGDVSSNDEDLLNEGIDSLENGEVEELCWSRFGISFPLCIGDLFFSLGIHVEEVETEVDGEGGVDGAKAKDELVRVEVVLGNAWEVGEGVEDGVALL